MTTTEFAVKNYRFVVVFTLAALALGALGYVKMPRQEDPNLPAFGGSVTVVLPSATPEEVEDRIVEPLEEEIFGLEEVLTIESSATNGVGTVIAEFREDVDTDRAYDLFVQRVASVRSELPADIIQFETREIKPSNVVVLQAAIFGEAASHREIRRWAEELEHRWQVIADVKDVTLEGIQEQEVHVIVDPDRLAAAGLTAGQVARAIASANDETPGGTVQAEGRRLMIRPNARLQTPQDVGNTVIANVDGRPIRVAEMAEVVWGDEDPSYLVRHQGQRAGLVTATLKEGRNVFAMAEAAKAELERLQSEIPDHLRAELALDQSVDVSKRLNLFARSLLQGIAIIVLFVALIAGWRPALVIISAMLIAQGIAFWLMDALGLSLQQMSIAGLVVVLGLLVDNAIVVVEGILQERHRGLGAIKAAIVGTDRVASAVASSTATTVAAFVPMLFMAGSVGDFTRDIPTVVVLVLIVSLGVALFVTPLLASRVFRTKNEIGAPPVSRWLEHVAYRGFYAHSLSAILRHPRTTIALILLGGGLMLAGSSLVGMNFFPRADDKPVFLVRIQTPTGSTLRQAEQSTIEVENFLQRQSWVHSMTSNIGEGNPMVYYNLIRVGQAPHRSEILVRVPREESQRIPEFARDVREAFARHPDLTVETKMLVQGPPVGLPVSVRITGPDLERLRQHADALAGQLRDIPGAINVTHELRPGPARLDLTLDPVAINKLGLNPEIVGQEVRLAMAGGRVTTLRQGDEDFDVVVRLAPEGNEQLVDLDRVRIPSPSGLTVPLSQLTRPELSSSYAAIQHTDLKRSVVVGADLDDRLATEIVADLLPHIESLPLNAEERFQIIGEDEERDRAFLSMLTNVILALGLIYGVLVLQFRSFKLPLIIFAAIPVALAGSVIGLLVGGWPFGFTAFIGLLALTGIVVNDAIVLVDQVNQLRREGKTLPKALREGSASRLQPILLTSFTTIAGLLPLTLFGGSMWGPMGWVIIGGLLVATVVTLALVPALYFLLERGQESRATSPQPVERKPVAAGAMATIALLMALPAQAETSLRDVLDAVDANNPQLLAESSTVAGAEAQWRGAKSQRWPRVSAQLDWVRTDDPGTVFGLALQDVANPMDLLSFESGSAARFLTGGAGVSWVLYDRSRGFSVRAAQHALRAQEHQRDATRALLRLAATHQYFFLVQLDQEAAVQNATLEQLEQEMADAQLRLDAGRGLRSDVLGLSARHAEVLAQLAATEGAQRVARARLAELTAQPQESLRVDPGTTIQASAAAGADARARFELAAAEAGRDAAQASVGEAQGKRFPQVVAQARIDFNAIEEDFDRETDWTTLSLGLRWTPFAGGAIGAEADQRRAEARRAEHQVSARELELVREHREAESQFTTAQAQQAAAGRQLEAAEEAYRIVQLRFREGRATLSRFLDAEVALTRARTATVRTAAALEVAKAQVAWAIGREIVAP